MSLPLGVNYWPNLLMDMLCKLSDVFYVIKIVKIKESKINYFSLFWTTIMYHYCPYYLIPSYFKRFTVQSKSKNGCNKNQSFFKVFSPFPPFCPTICIFWHWLFVHHWLEYKIWNHSEYEWEIRAKQDLNSFDFIVNCFWLFVL